MVYGQNSGVQRVRTAPAQGVFSHSLKRLPGHLTRLSLLVVVFFAAGMAYPALADEGDAISPNGAAIEVLPPAVPSPPDNSSSPVPMDIPVGEMPKFSSLPSSPYKIYLNFTGATINSWGGYSPGVLQPYDQNGDPTTFSVPELDSIDQIWARVAEDYSPFNVDVTTISPGSFGVNQAVQVMISGSGAWYGTPAGGLAQLNSFNNAAINASAGGTVFVFPGWLRNGTAKYVAVASAHEAGHAFGLVHQSTYNTSHIKTAEYGPGTWPGDPQHPFNTPGTGYKSPVMGLGYYADRALWWYGTGSYSWNSYQDDLSVLSANVFGYRPANANNSQATATPLADSSGGIATSGIIRKTTDQYFYSFTTPGGTATINMAAARFTDSSGSTSVIGMLNSQLRLFDSSGNLIASAGTAASPTSPSLDATLSLSLSGGVYYVAAGSIGNYGDIGQFTLDGAIVPPGPAMIGLAPQNATIITGGTGTLGATISNTAAPFNHSLSYSILAALTGGTATLAALTPSSGTIAAGSSQLATLAATSTVLGSHTVGFTAADPNAANGPQTATATLTVLDHSRPALAASNPSHSVVIVGAQGVTANLTLFNGTPGQTGLAPLDVAAGPGVSGPVGSQIVASGLLQSYTGTLNTAALGPHSQTFKITAGDAQALSGAAPLIDFTAGISYTVMDHANASLSATTGLTSATIDFGNLLQGAAPQSRTFAIYNVAANTSAALTSNLMLTGFSASGDDAVTTDLAAFGGLAAGSGKNFTAAIDTSRMTANGRKIVIMDAAQLLDDSTLPGAGGNNNGALSVVLKATVGAATADNSNSQNTFGPALYAAVPKGGSYAGLQSQAMAVSGSGGGPLVGTSATLLAGTASAAATVQMSWRTAAEGPLGQGDGTITDIVHVSGLPIVGSQTHNGAAHTDVYVVRMSYDPAAIAARTGLSESDAAQAGLISLDYLDPGADAMPYTEDDRWTLATEGNIGGSNRFEGVTPWEGDMQLGDYGVDTASHTVWAVVDHGGDFAVVPEPATWALVLAAVTFMFSAVRLAASRRKGL